MNLLDPVPIHAAALSLTVVLAMAAAHKFAAPARFAEQLAAYALLPPALVAPAARALPFLEALLALALLLPATRAAAGIGAAVLLAGYGGAIALNLLRGRRDIDCGCSGPGLERPLSPALLGRNALLAGIGLLAAAEPLARPLAWFDLFVIVAASATLLLLYAAVEGLQANAPRLARLIGR